MWADRIPLGVVTVFAGYGGEGKSTFALHLAAQLNSGTLVGDLRGDPRTVLIVSHEDDLATVMKPRLSAAGADTSMVYHLTIRSKVDELTTETIPALPEDALRIRQAITDTGASLVVIDPITSTMAGDLHKVADVRAALNPLAAIAQETDIAVIAIMHLNKSAGSLSARLSGSHAFRDVSRSVLVFATDDDTGNRVVTLDKANYSETTADSFAFAIRSTEITTDDGDVTMVGKVDYLGDTDLNVQSILDRGRSDDAEQEDRNAAKSFIVDYLKSRESAEANAGDVLKAGRAAGFSDNELKHARQRARHPRIESRKSGYGAGWIWGIGSEGAEGARAPTVGTFGTFPAPSSGNSHSNERTSA